MTHPLAWLGVSIVAGVLVIRLPSGTTGPG